MQKLLLATAVAVSTSFASFAASAADNAGSGAFAHIGMGQARYHSGIKPLDRRKDRTYDFLGGYRWGLGRSFALGVEGGLAQLGSVDRMDRDASNTTYELSARTWLAGANAKWNVTRNFSLTGRAGSAWAHSRYKEANDSFRTKARRTHTVAYLGLGTSFALTDHVDLTAQATRYALASSARMNRDGGSSVTTYNAGVEYRF